MNGRECIWRGLADAQETWSGLTVVDELSAASGVCLANQRTDTCPLVFPPGDEFNNP